MLGEDLVCRVRHFVGQMRFEIILGQDDEGVLMIGYEFHDLLVVRDRIPPVFFLFFDLGHQKIGVGIFRVNFKHVS